MTPSMWDALAELGNPTSPVEVYEWLGSDRSGGYTVHVFDEPYDLHAIIRPWQENEHTVSELGQTGQTPVYAMFVSSDSGLKINDRIHWEGGEFRAVTPRHDAFGEFDRWYLYGDERDLVTADDVSQDVLDDLDEPDRDGVRGFMDETSGE